MASDKDLIVAYVLNSLIHHDLEKIPLPWRKGINVEPTGIIDLGVEPPTGETKDFNIAITTSSGQPIKFNQKYVVYGTVLLPLSCVPGTFYLAEDVLQTTDCFISQYGNSEKTAGRTILEFYTSNKLTGIFKTNVNTAQVTGTGVWTIKNS